MSALVLDSEAFSALAGPKRRRQADVRAAMEVAWERGAEVIVPTIVLAELYRGRRRAQLIDSCLSRETGIRARDTDKALARIVGGVLDAARAGSVDIVDAHVVAVAIEAGGGAVLTGDRADMVRLSGSYPTVTVEPLD